MIPLRSFLFIPGDSEKKLGKAAASGADCVILDLEDAVASERKTVARDLVATFLSEPRSRTGPQVWVRINSLQSRQAMRDLVSVVPAAPDGIMIPKVNGPRDVERISDYLDALEAAALHRGAPVLLLPVATETPIAPFNLGAFAEAGLSRLYGLTWGAEDLSTAIGASTNRDPDGELALTYRLVRSLTLLAARAAGVEPVETLYSDYRDLEGLERSCRAARREGFSGRIAIHPDQVETINRCFSPCEQEVEEARRIIDAFAGQPTAGTVGLDGRMLDLPHLRQAERTLAIHEALTKER